VVWFSIARVDRPAEPPAPPAPADAERVWTTAEQARWLLHVPPGLVDRLEPVELVAELVRRLRELLDAESVSVEVDEGDGTGPREVARDGSTVPGGGPSIDVRLPTTPPLRGVLRVVHRVGGTAAADPDRTRDLTELIAYRVAMAVESQWLRAV